MVGNRIRRRFAAHVRAATTAVFFVCLSSALGCAPSKIRCLLNGRLWTGGAPSTDTASEAATFHVEVEFALFFWSFESTVVLTSNSCEQAAPYKSNLPNSKLERETGTAPAPWWWKPQTLLADPGNHRH